MSVTLPGGTTRDDALAAYHTLVAELRDVEHWRRLVAARLDLAVAAVTDIDDLALHPAQGGLPPDDLRALLGIPHGADACEEAAALVRLRTALARLDTYAAALRPGVVAAARAAGVPAARMAVVGAPRSAPSRTKTSRTATSPATPGGAVTPIRAGRRPRLVPPPRPASP
jgi:hypothetical protein